MSRMGFHRPWLVDNPWAPPAERLETAVLMKWHYMEKEAWHVLYSIARNIDRIRPPQEEGEIRGQE